MLQANAWQKQGQPQQNLPYDDSPGINTFGFDTTQNRTPVPFWSLPVASLDPSNAQFSSWAVVKLAGQVLPGLCAVRGKRGQRFDVKRVKGADFATLTKQGYDPADITIVHRIWTPQHLYALWQIMPILEAPTLVKPDGTLDAVDIYHPALALRDVRSVVVKSISFLHPSQVVDVMEEEFELMEYRPLGKKNATATANGSSPYKVQTVSNQAQVKASAAPTPPSSSDTTVIGP